MHKKKRTTRSANRTMNYLAAGGKKTVLAIGLVVIMAIMWFRVLTGHKPQSAASKPLLNSPEQDQSPVQVRFHNLPIIQGRNDRIDQNFFTVQDWNGFSRDANKENAGTDPEVHVVAPDRTQEVIARVAQRLKLGAVLWSENPQIFANDQFYQVGDTIKLQEGADTYKFEVVQIEADSVLVRCRERELTLNLAQSNDVSK
jgi:hypothetical protein